MDETRSTVRDADTEESSVDIDDVHKMNADIAIRDQQQSSIVNTESSEKEVPDENDLSKFQRTLSDHFQKISEILRSVKELQLEAKTIEKDFQSVVKYLQKSTKKKKTAARPLSGFAVPTKLTDELYEFLKIQPGTLIARKDVTKMMNTYIVENNCRDTLDRRKIIPNAALKKLFQCEEDENITYFNLQSYMKKHYKK